MAEDTVQSINMESREPKGSYERFVAWWQRGRVGAYVGSGESISLGVLLSETPYANVRESAWKLKAKGDGPADSYDSLLTQMVFVEMAVQKKMWENPNGYHSDKMNVAEFANRSPYPEVIEYALKRAEDNGYVLTQLALETNDKTVVARIARFASKKNDLLSLCEISDKARVNKQAADEQLSNLMSTSLANADAKMKREDFLRVLKTALIRAKMGEIPTTYALHRVRNHPDAAAEVAVKTVNMPVSKALVEEAVEAKEYGMLFKVATAPENSFGFARMEGLGAAWQVQDLAVSGLKAATPGQAKIILDGLVETSRGERVMVTSASNALQGLLRYGNDEVSRYLINEMTQPYAPAEHPEEVKRMWTEGKKNNSEGARRVPRIPPERIERAEKQLRTCDIQWRIERTFKDLQEDRKQNPVKCCRH